MRDGCGNPGRTWIASASGITAERASGEASERCGPTGKEGTTEASAAEGPQQLAGARALLASAASSPEHGQQHPKRVAQGKLPTSKNSSTRVDTEPRASAPGSQDRQLRLPLTCMPIRCISWLQSVREALFAPKLILYLTWADRYILSDGSGPPRGRPDPRAIG